LIPAWEEMLVDAIVETSVWVGVGTSLWAGMGTAPGSAWERRLENCRNAVLQVRRGQAVGRSSLLWETAA
jgi:hypothetical protein